MELGGYIKAHNTLTDILFFLILVKYLCPHEQVEIYEINTERAPARAKDRLYSVLWEYVFIPHIFRVRGI